MNKKNKLAQYYTPSHIANIIAKKSVELLGNQPNRAIELAAGEGHLLSALKKYAPACEIHAVDIDTYNSELLKRNNNEYYIYNLDATKNLIEISDNKFDLGIGNPPFLTGVTVDEYIHNLLNETIKLNIPLGERCRVEYIFICQYIKKILDGGVCAIIVPSSIVSGVKSKEFRESIVTEWTILEVIEIEGSQFSDTEAKTFVIFIKKLKNKNNKVSLQLLKSNGEVSKAILVDKDKTIERMDYTHHSKRIEKQHHHSYVKLGDIASITRGNITHAELKKKNDIYIHSTTFNENFDSDFKIEGKHHVHNGDLIMCRVGSRVVGKIREYKGGSVVFSDCIYRIRFHTQENKKSFVEFLNSDEWGLYKQSILRGVCSQYISKSDLTNLSIPISI